MPREEASPDGADALACLRALSIVLDLANGLREDKNLATALFAYLLAQRLALSPADRAHAFYAALLRHLGCTAYAHREAEFVEDDILLRRAMATRDHRDPHEVAQMVVIAHPHADPSQALAWVAASGAQGRRAWTEEACGGARALASAMGFAPPVLLALDEVFERWDGQGAPRARAEESISLVGRIAAVAHVTLAHHTLVGPDAARSVLARAGDGELDPRLAKLALDVLDEHPDALLAGADERLSGFAAVLAAHGPHVDARCIAEAFGDFADLQSQHTRGHARGVAKLVGSTARTLGLSAAEERAVVLAAHLHDVGAAAVPTRIWETRDRWSEAARERARMHVYYTERALALAPPLHAAGPIAGAHHERLDAGGYHRGLASERIGVAARLLAAADVFHALREDRPHRAAMTRSAAKETLAQLGADGALDARIVDAVIAARSQRSEPGTRLDGLARLTEREREVLAGVARGLTNKEIAASLQISDRTVQSHTLNVYAKLEVSTRAAAAIAASRAGLLDLG